MGYVFPLKSLFVPALAPYSGMINGNFGLISALLISGGLPSLAALFWRYRAAQGRERQQMKWFLWMAGDRRFYRRKYAAARTLAQFGASLRDDATFVTSIQPSLCKVPYQPKDHIRFGFRSAGGAP